MKDFSFWMKFEGASEGSGRSEKLWLINPDTDQTDELSPLYDNSSSLCAYVKEDKIDQYLGKDMRLWRSLIDTKSRSLIRISVSDEKQPTHLDVLKYLRQNYYSQTIEIVNKIELTVTDVSLDDILYKYAEVLTDKKIILIKKYLLGKIELMKEVYGIKREG